MKTAIQSLRIYLALTLLTGIFYPLAITGVAQVLFPKQANGSRIVEQGQLVGSALLAQRFESPGYFWTRPSAGDFSTVPSGASNKGPSSVDLRKVIDERREKFGQDAPVDLVTASGSGVDPHVSPEAARSQVARVAAARGLPAEKLAALVERSIEPPQLGFLGEPRVNVLLLNRALDRLQ